MDGYILGESLKASKLKQIFFFHFTAKTSSNRTKEAKRKT